MYPYNNDAHREIIYDRDRYPLISMMRMPRKQLAIGVAAALVAASVIAVGVTAVTRHQSSRAHRDLRIAGGTLQQDTFWGIWLYHSREHGDCWSARTLHAGHTVGESAACGFEVPQKAWQLIAASPIGQASASRFVLAFLVRANIRSLEVLVDDRATREKAQRIKLINHPISKIQLSRTQLPQNLGYAVAVLRGGEHCVRRVEVSGGLNKVEYGQLPRCS
jgi:hypothetical protein